MQKFRIAHFISGFLGVNGIILTICFVTMNQISLAQDSQSLKPTHLIYLQSGGNPSIFNIGYGLTLFQESRLSLEPKIGIGIDFIRFKPYNLEPLVKIRISYRFGKGEKIAVFTEFGLQYIFNPWYELDSAKYFPNCDTGRCPERISNFFFDLGLEYRFSKKLSLSAAVFENLYEKSYYLLPGIELKYNFNEK